MSALIFNILVKVVLVPILITVMTACFVYLAFLQIQLGEAFTELYLTDSMEVDTLHNGL